MLPGPRRSPGHRASENRRVWELWRGHGQGPLPKPQLGRTQRPRRLETDTRVTEQSEQRAKAQARVRGGDERGQAVTTGAPGSHSTSQGLSRPSGGS